MEKVKQFCKKHRETIVVAAVTGITCAFLAKKQMDKQSYIGYEPAFDNNKQLNAIILARKDGLFDVLTKQVDSDITFE